ncbi:hypothetical protein POJ06DRAFT_269009 [Lipomyces tetrasporus]|uniref:Uncharacterized protein n=1 Tax=Lipomyces tetrasporus TaxID=54092 RepID=A0AAD7VSY2_9ASCO|nr:uncharacterized protein POJ06DRAFT_269009 [Lipomyces tetrasporus]KAJ8100134.1 hypothetical protein POJ06DRAFT_269009 [Lipomyces tetrasporus]
MTTASMELHAVSAERLCWQVNQVLSSGFSKVSKVETLAFGLEPVSAVYPGFWLARSQLEDDGRNILNAKVELSRTTVQEVVASAKAYAEIKADQVAAG